MDVQKVGEAMGAIILFDGVCNLCNSSVQFILKKDHVGYFKFASLQGETGKSLLKQFALPDDINTIVVIENKKLYLKSSAVLKICSHLQGIWRVLTVFRFIPPFLRDPLYEFIANHRYKWFGKREICLIPSSHWKQRFLD